MKMPTYSRSAALGLLLAAVSPALAQTPLAISTPPQHAVVTPGQSTGLSVAATGGASSAAYTYQWRKDGVDLVGATHAALYLTGVHSGHVGDYDVRVSDGTSTVYSGPAAVRIGSSQRWQWRNRLPQGNDLSTVAFGGGRYVAAGWSGTILTSVNGTDWTAQPQRPPAALLNIVYNGSLFVVTGTGGNVLTSADGLNWHQGSVGQSVSLWGLAYGHGKWVATGTGGAVFTSTDAVTWTRQNLGTFSASINGVTATDAGFVAATAGGQILTSTVEAVNWSLIGLPAAANATLFDVKHRSGVTVAVGAQKIVVSTNAATLNDGATWTAVTLPINATTDPGIDWNEIVATTDGFMVAGASYPTTSPTPQAYVIHSVNGTDWTRKAVPSSPGLIGITHGPSGYVAVGVLGQITRSADGTIWTAASTGFAFLGDIYGAATSPSGTVLVGKQGAVYRSTNHLDGWARVDAGTTHNLYAATYSGGRYVVVGGNDNAAAGAGVGVVLSSATGAATSWSKVELAGPAFLGAIAFEPGQGRFVAAGAGDKIYHATDPAGTWSEVTKPSATPIRAAAAGNGTYVLVGDNGTVFVSRDAVAWSAPTPVTPVQLTAAAFGGGTFVAAGFSASPVRSVFIRSTDLGATWQLVNVPYTGSIRGIAYADGRFRTVGGTSTILTSTNGLNWSADTSQFAGLLRAIVRTPAGYLAAGTGGAILTLPAPTATTVVPEATLVAEAAATPFTPVTASGGTPGYMFSVQPALPPGLALDGTSGAVTGTPTAAATTPVFAGADDFNTGSLAKWAYSFRTFGGATGNGMLNAANSRLEFSKGPGEGGQFRGWDGDPATLGVSRTTASLATSWVADVTVTNALVPAATEFSSVGFEIAGGNQQWSGIMLINTGGTLQVRGHGSGMAQVDVSATQNTNVKLRLAWNAATQVLTGSYSFDGGSTYTTIPVAAPMADWMAGTAANGFFFEVFANSNVAAAITDGSIRADDFRVVATSPAAAIHTVTATDAAGVTARSSFKLTVTPTQTDATTIAGISPAGAPVGATVAINGTNLAGATAVRFNGIDATSFTVVSATQIQAVVPSGATTGNVTVTSAAGAVVSSPAVFTVGVPPTILEPPFARRAVAGGTAQFRVAASGPGPLTYQWRKHGVAIPGATGSELRLGRLRLEEAGAYSVRVSSGGIYTDSPEAALTVLPASELPWQQFTEVSTEHSPARTVHDGTGRVYVPWSVHDRNPDMAAGQFVGGLARFLESDGARDHSFRLDPRYRGVTHLAVQPDGKLVLAVRVGDANTVIRTDTAGHPDATFHAPLFAHGIRFVVLQPADGKILVTATDNRDANAPAAAIGADAPTVYRLNGDGSIDSGFTPAVLGGSFPNLFAPPVVDAAGRIYLAGGFGAISGSSRINVARLEANGTVDDAYAKPGTAALPAGFAGAQARAVVLQSDGRAVFVGDFRSTARGTSSDPMMAIRFSAAGVFDDTFARPLRSELGLGAPGVRLRYALREADDKIIAVSDRLIRLNADGSVDAGFVSRAFAQESFWVSRDSTGRHYVADQSGVMGPTAMTPLAGNGIARFQANGNYDPSFQTGGWGRVAYPTSAAVLSDGRIWGAGDFNRFGGAVAPGLAQFSADGLFNPVEVSLPFAGRDDFSGSGGNWAGDFRITSGTNGLLSFTGSVLEFTKSTGAGSHFRIWDADSIPGNNIQRVAASVNHNWVMEVSASNLVVAETGKFAAIGVEVAAGPGAYTAIMLENFGGALKVIGETNTFTNQVAVTAPVNTGVRLRLAWDAAAQTLTGSHSFDGGASYATLMTVPISTWPTAPTAGFSFEAFGNANVDPAIGSGQMRLDDFSVHAARPSDLRSMTYATIAPADGDRIFAVLTTSAHSLQDIAPSLVRIRADSRLDVSFAPVLPAGYDLNSASLYAAPGGKLLLAQSRITPQAALRNETGDALLRLNADGTRDTGYTPSLSSFAVVERSSPTGPVTMIRTGGLNVAQVLPDGSALVIVSAVDGNLRLLKLTPSGAVDGAFNAPSFGTIVPAVGFTTTLTDPVTNETRQFNISTYSAADLVQTAVQMPNGKIYVGGRFQLGGGPRGLVRLNANGSLDTTFAGAGVAYSRVDAGPYVCELAVDAAGRLYAAGRFDSYNGVSAHGIFRLRADGQFDGGWSPPFIVADAPAAAVLLIPVGPTLHAFGTIAIPGEPYPALYASAAIPPPPAITTAPVATTATSGGTATFSVTATGAGPFTYQWLKNGYPISGGTGATLVLTGVSASSTGNYSVAVTGPGGTTVTAPVPLVVDGAAVAITHQPQSQAVSVGQAFMLTVGASGTPPFMFEWRKNGVALSGATHASYSVASAQTTDAGTYTVVVSGGGSSVVSNAAEIAILPAGTGAAHAVVGGGYTAGGTVTITNTLTFTATNALGWQVLLPPGWSFVSDAGTVGNERPTVGQTDVLEWAWQTVPASPVTFTYTVSVPAGVTWDEHLAALMILRQDATTGLRVLAKPDPLLVPNAATHSADTDRDFRLSLYELTRVIELYNTRNGTTRTGAYRVLPTTEDGFATDATRPAGQVVTLERYHSADTQSATVPRDGSIGLAELTRVIQLYNHRQGTVRTGAYRVQSGTEDGFAPGPAAAP